MKHRNYENEKREHIGVFILLKNGKEKPFSFVKHKSIVYYKGLETNKAKRRYHYILN